MGLTFVAIVAESKTEDCNLVLGRNLFFLFVVYIPIALVTFVAIEVEQVYC